MAVEQVIVQEIVSRAPNKQLDIYPKNLLRNPWLSERRGE